MDEPVPSKQSPVLPEPSTSTSSPSSSHKFHPYTTPNHRVTKGRYITSTDPRGYVPVYEYPLNNQWIMMDVDDGFVLWTGIWKALGNSKADIVRMVEAQPELASQIRRVRGGYLKIQGTWLPYEVALRLARRVAWPIRHDLVPLFGPTFPDTCLSPDQPGYGQVIPSSGRKGKRSKYQTTAIPATTASAPLAASENASSGDSTAYRSHPYSPGSVTSTESPYDSPSYEVGGQGGAYYHQGYYQAMPTSAPGPATTASQYGSGRQQQYSYAEEAADLSRTPSTSSTTRHRYAPYPPSSRSPGPPAQPLATPRQDLYTATPLPPSTTPPHPPPPLPHSRRHRSPVRDTRYDLPPISTIDLPRPSQQGLPAPPQGFSLPPITSLQGGDKPDMDASAVLRRLRLDEPDVVPPGRREDSYKPVYGGGQQQQQQQQAGPAYPPGPPTYYGDASYQYEGRGGGGGGAGGGRGYPRERNGPDPRWVSGSQPPQASQYHPGVAARGEGGRQW